MKKIMMSLAGVLIALSAGATGGAAQQSVAQHTPARAEKNIIRHNGKIVEVLGLRRWTLKMVQDSLAKYAPEDSLHTHGCAAALRYKVHFADAAAMGFRDPSGNEITVIVVREPQDSGRVELRTAQFDSTGERREWAPITKLYRENFRAFQFALSTYVESANSANAGSVSARVGKDSLAVRAIWATIAQFRNESDRRSATLAVLSDPNYVNRLAAVAILANFPQYDETWWALVETMREDDGSVKGMAASVAQGLARTASRTIDWTPVLPAIRTMLDGTSPFSLGELIQVLNATSISTSHTAYLLGGGDQLIYEFAGSIEPGLSGPAQMLLKKLSGQDFGGDAVKWRHWAKSLQ